eukprot:CAMPEP_0116864470 /NCGR_PEP_ID=MMETSP0418-20121206/24838_1 /TAXON_ID=1158023 /ORGANISM="Astrosyne radiata, Strain 13vi08-1A" /LENGTH=166 /DNA_ID=CAMNT_0004499691 /DNA_START=272 /DNA_END=770 /DNA_ORIENTATION=+
MHKRSVDQKSKSASSTLLPVLQDTGIVPAVSDNVSQDSAPVVPEDALQSIIYYNAEDSIVLDVKRQTSRLYKAGIIEYDNIRLEAEEIFLDLPNHIIAAFSKKDKAGNVEKKAVLTKDNVEYFAESIRYNFDSQRAIAKLLTPPVILQGHTFMQMPDASRSLKIIR